MSARTLADLRDGLQRYVKRISKAAYLLKVEVGPIVNDRFTIHAYWRGGETLITITGDESKWRACQMAQRIIESILRSRRV